MALTSGTAVIQTRRLQLAPLGLADAAAMVNGHQPPEQVWADGYPTDGTLLAAALVVAAIGEGRPLGAFGTYQIVRREDSLVIGDCGFLGPPDGEGTVHVGYVVCQPERNQSYAIEALGALVEWALAQPTVRRVRSDSAHTNLAGIRVMEGAGMRRRFADDRLVYYEA